MPKRLAVLASGTGTLLEAMLEQGLPIELVITDRPCRAFDIADNAGLARLSLHRSFQKDFDRRRYTDWVLQELRDQEIELVAMAGYMTVFSPQMFAPDAYQMRILNTHPSLLPAFKGDHAVRDALEYGVKVSGCTIHYATEDLDAGPIIEQAAICVRSDDTEASLHERIKEAERVLYPAVLKRLLA